MSNRTSISARGQDQDYNSSSDRIAGNMTMADAEGKVITYLGALERRSRTGRFEGREYVQTAAVINPRCAAAALDRRTRDTVRVAVWLGLEIPSLVTQLTMNCGTAQVWRCGCDVDNLRCCATAMGKLEVWRGGGCEEEVKGSSWTRNFEGRCRSRSRSSLGARVCVGKAVGRG